MEIYHIIDNGIEPFKVEINKKQKTLNVFKLTKQEVDDKYNVISREYGKKVVNTKYVNVFIGKSPKNKMTLFSKGYGKKFDGNSIVAQLNSNTYLYIGSMIYSFVVDNDEEIRVYKSPVGNNLFPYPYAISNKRVYFFVERIMIDLEAFPIKIKENTKEDLYEFLYNNDDVSKQARKIKKVKVIQKKVSVF